jgi:hypothetical protein
MSEICPEEVQPVDFRLMKGYQFEVRHQVGILYPPKVPRLNAYFKLGKMFWVGHDSSGQRWASFSEEFFAE